MINNTKELKKMSNTGDKMRYNIKDYLTKNEVDKLMDLFNKVKLDLSDSSFPTRTNRLEAVENMKKVLKIHNYNITDKVPTEPTKFTDALDHHEIMQKGIVR
jgi:hypothetical protein